MLNLDTLSHKNTYVFTFLASFFSIFILYQFNYTAYEGFSPTDDGVILAQSFRILHGEIPHLDFISLKPCFSAYIHTLHFFSGLALMDSCRVLVLFQYFSFTILWLIFLVEIFEVKINIFIFNIIVLAIVFINLNHSFLFPWTTTDAIWLSSFSLPFVLKVYLTKNKASTLLYQLFALFFLSLAALCRQSFVFLVLGLWVYFVFVNGFNFKRIALCILAAKLPFIVYFAYLFHHHALTTAVHQLLGRTEFFDTAILRLAKSFLKDKLLPIYLNVFAVFIFSSYKKIKFQQLSVWLSRFNIILLILLAFVFALIHEPMLMIYPWAFFFFLLNSVLVNQISNQACSKIFPLVLVFFQAWVASISMGVNSPVYFSGILFFAALMINIYTLKGNFNFIIIGLKAKIASFSILCSLIIAFYIGQKKYNYQDKPSSELRFSVAKLIPAFGKTMTNKNTYLYFTDLTETMKAIPKNAPIVFLPNNAALYPLLNVHNPFPLDWMQHDEYIGSEILLQQKMEVAMKRQQVYFIADLFQTKKMWNQWCELDFEKANFNSEDLFIKKYKTDKYGYWKFLESKTTEVKSKSSYFRIWKSVIN